ncbi:hypothetical protein FRB93_000762 [Tulasnella sp. JGI-2019a]|nr:hypothetical protein FRB93_000762 [Tulasnella sp. JGI-2019a]
MSNPTDNTTTPEQTQSAQAHHGAYHKGCAAYSAWYNATLSSSAAPSSTSTSSSTIPTVAPVTSSGSKTNIAPIVGGAVGGFFGLILILAILFLIYRYMQNKHEQTTEGTTGRMSMFSGGFGGSDGQPYKFEVGTAPTGVTPIVGPESLVGHNSGGVASPESARTPPPNQHVVPTLHSVATNPYQDDMSEFRDPGSGSLSPAPMYQPQPQLPPQDWRESLASSGTYDRYDTSMAQHRPTSSTGPSQPPIYGSGNDIILEGQGGPRSSTEKRRM